MQGLDTVFAISCGIATIYALDGLISYFDLQADGFGEHGHGHGHTSSTPTPILPIPSVSPQGKSKPRAEHGAAQAARARSALLTTLALAAHNAPEGLAVGMASLQESTPAAVAADGANTAGAAGPDASQHTALVVFAIGLHNIPEGIAVREHVDTRSDHLQLSLFLKSQILPRQAALRTGRANRHGMCVLRNKNRWRWHCITRCLRQKPYAVSRRTRPALPRQTTDTHQGAEHSFLNTKTLNELGFACVQRAEPS